MDAKTKKVKAIVNGFKTEIMITTNDDGLLLWTAIGKIIISHQDIENLIIRKK